MTAPFAAVGDVPSATLFIKTPLSNVDLLWQVPDIQGMYL